MQTLKWLDCLPDKNLEGGVNLANQIQWYLTVGQREQKWYVFGGHCLLLVTDSRAAVDAFLYGMGLAYALLPEPTFARLRAEVKRLME